MSEQHPNIIYRKLGARLDQFPQGAPPSNLLYRILSLMFSEKDAELVCQLPLRPVTAHAAAQIWQITEREAARILESLAARALFLDLERGGEMVYVLPPPMAGFFEFSLMRVRQDLDQKVLSELLFQYLNVEEDFIRDLLAVGETAAGRIFVNERALGKKLGPVVLDYERASETIRNASHLAVGLCYCRRKMSLLDRGCNAPQEICMTLNMVAESLIRHGNARRIDASEGVDLLQEAWSRNLVQCGDNVREGVNFLCNCCACCCEPLLAVRKFSIRQPIYTSNYLPELDRNRCSGCGKCIDVCPVEAVVLVSANDGSGRRRAALHEEGCLGCGVCVRVCGNSALNLVARGQRVVTPVNTAHRVVLMAIERGKLPQLIFDRPDKWSHRTMATILGAILKLPPAKRLLANQQVKSKYLERLLHRVDLGMLART